MAAKEPESSISSRSNQVKSVHRALMVLRALAQDSKGTRLSELARNVHMNASSLHHLLKTLQTEGFVEFDEEGKLYRVGISAYLVGNAYVGPFDLRQLALPFMERLVKQCNENVYMAVLNAGGLVHVAQVECSHAVRASINAAATSVTHCTALGKVLLAALSPAQLQVFIEAQGLPACTPHTITDFPVLAEHLESVRQQGYALDLEESEEGLCCIGTPIRNHQGKTIAALSMSMPKQRFVRKRIAAYFEMCDGTSQQISECLGYVPGGGRS